MSRMTDSGVPEVAIRLALSIIPAGTTRPRRSGGQPECRGDLRSQSLGQPLPDEEPGAMHARLHVADIDRQGAGDLGARPALDVSQNQGGTIVGRQLIDR